MSAETIVIPLDRVLIGDRLRPVDPDYVALIAASMAESGQLTPVHVGPADDRGRHRLIAGAHRCAALKAAGIAEVRAIVFSGSQIEAELLEIDENLMRHELTELDRAVFLAKRHKLYLALNPQTRHGGARQGRAAGQVDKNVHLIPRQESFADVTAAKLGITPRHVRRYLSRAAQIQGDWADRLRATRWADNGAVLDALAKAKPTDRAQLIAALTRHANPAKSLAAAKAEVFGRAETGPDERQLAALESAWRKAGRAAREGFAARVARTDADRALFQGWLTRYADRAADAAGEEAEEDRVLAALARSNRAMGASS